MANSRVDMTVDINMLKMLQEISSSNSCVIDDLIDEALTDLIKKYKQVEQPRQNIMRAYQQSHETYASLYERLAQ